jgi:SAM-dependent methyltransferase
MSKIGTLIELIKFSVFPDFGKEHWQNLPESTVQFWTSQPENVKMNDFLCRVLEQYTPTTSLVEIGCDTGQRLKAIHTQFPHLRLKGIEINSFAATKGNIDLRNLGIGENTIICSDLMELPNQMLGQFSGILSWAVLMYVHPIRIKNVIETLLDLADEMIIILEPTSSKGLQHLFPKRNLSFCHNYLSIFGSLQLSEYEVIQEDIPRSIWSPRYGDAKVIIFRKLHD